MLSVDLLHHYRRLADSQFTVVDLETTGGNTQSDRITEISVLQASLASGIQDQSTHLVNPQIDIPEKIVRLTGITAQMVADAPVASDVLPQFMPWLEQGILTGHNVAFDYGFLQAEFARQNQPFSRPSYQQLCTVQLARLMLADLPSRRLPKLVKHFKFDVGTSHRAAADTQACWLLLSHLLTEVLTEDDEALLSRFRQEWIPLRIAAKLLGCSGEAGLNRLTAANVPHRLSSRSSRKVPMYRRGNVEDICLQQGIQLSLV
ncbi:MAG: 3'-5' exonuclease [Elainellaceae cyanobacterium]